MNRYQQYMYSYPHKTAYGPLDLRFDDYRDRLHTGGANSLYVHIPFCEAKCGYCNLFSLAGAGEALADEYLNAIERQLTQYDLARIAFRDLTLGGGTPLALTLPQLERLFGLAEQVQYDQEQPDIVVETSPRQTTDDRVRLLIEHEVRRVSMGVQSFDDGELRTLGRIHRAADILRALDKLKTAHFPCLNMDLIYGVPGQTIQSLSASLRQALAYEPEEIFLYPLYVRAGTGLYRQGQRVSDDAYDQYRRLTEQLLAAGYGQTSMRRFVRGWQQDEAAAQTGCGYAEHTISLGCGGRSYIDELHFCQPYSVRQETCAAILRAYIKRPDHLAINHGYLLSVDERKRRFVLKNLLYVQGLPIPAYIEYFHSSPWADFPLLVQWQQAGYAQVDAAENLRLTAEGLALSDYLGPMLISAEVRAKMEAWRDA